MLAFYSTVNLSAVLNFLTDRTSASPSALTITEVVKFNIRL